MKFAKSLTAAAVLGVFVAGSAWANADKPMKLRQVFGDFNSAAGYEVAVPFFKFNSPDAGGYPASITMAWKVYTAGTGTLLYTSAGKALPMPAVPAGCSTTDTTGGKWFDFDQDLRVARREDELKWDSGTSSATFSAGANRAHIALNVYIECFDGTAIHEAQTSAVYSGRLDAAAAGTEWIKVFAGAQVEGLNGVDQTGDLINDAVMITKVQQTTAGGDITFVFLNAGNGSPTSPVVQPAAKTYPFFR